MSMTSFDHSAGASEAPATIRVWDPYVRVFHWSLVILFTVAFLTGDEMETVHIWAGYAIAGLVAMRIGWGFVGPKYARFSDFVAGPGTVWSFMRQSMRLQAPRYLGHNPAGGAMVLLLLAMLIGLSVTGILITTDAYWGSKVLEDVHEVMANITLGLIGLHIVGVILASIEHGENLVKAMFTGRKEVK